MTHTGDGDVPDDGRRKRRRRRRGRRGKSGAAGATSSQPSPATGTRSEAAPASVASEDASVGAGAANRPAASKKRKSRSRRRRSGGRTSSAPSTGTPTSSAPSSSAPSTLSSGPVPSGPAPSDHATADPAPARNSRSRNAKRPHHGRTSGTTRNADTKRVTDASARAADSATVAAAESAAVPTTRTSEADALAARRARADRETSAGGIVYRVQNGEALFLIIRDSYRNWGFPKGHLEGEELPDEAAIREVQEETGLVELQLDGAIETIDWFFRFRGRLVHKVCHFYLMRTENSRTVPQREEGITACRWARFEEATRLISYANARSVLSRANAMVLAGAGEPDGAVTGASGNAGAGMNANAADAARG